MGINPYCFLQYVEPNVPSCPCQCRQNHPRFISIPFIGSSWSLRTSKNCTKHNSCSKSCLHFGQCRLLRISQHPSSTWVCIRINYYTLPNKTRIYSSSTGTSSLPLSSIIKLSSLGSFDPYKHLVVTARCEKRKLFFGIKHSLLLLSICLRERTGYPEIYADPGT